MKTPLLFAILNLALASATFGQGSLTPPPGPPAPTMKTLDQVEARTIVNATNTPGDAANSFIISAPGSYYLTGNLTGEANKHGISIQANDVSLDLNGFALLASGAGTRGINVPAEQSGFGLRNGTVRGWADGGVRADLMRAVHAEKLRLIGNTGAVGIQAGLGSLIKECLANANGVGFRVADRCHILQCISTENTGFGFEGTSYITLMDCTASRNGNSGIKVQGSNSILRCGASRNEGHGIEAGRGCTITDCTAGVNGVIGIVAYECTVTGCAAESNGNDGILAESVTNSTAHRNGARGIFGRSVANCVANENLNSGIFAPDGTVAGCTTSRNGTHGIQAVDGSVTNCTALENVATGILAHHGSVTNCMARSNGSDGIAAASGVIAFCRARYNNMNNNGSVNINSGASTSTGNNSAND